MCRSCKDKSTNEFKSNYFTSSIHSGGNILMGILNFVLQKMYERCDEIFIIVVVIMIEISDYILRMLWYVR